MKQSKLFRVLFPFIMMLIPWIYLAFIWNELPQTIPTHFGLDGVPDTFGSKNNILIMPAVFFVLGVLMYFFILNIHRIDPKKKYTVNTASLFSKLAVLVVIIFCAVCMFMFHWTLKGKVEGIPVLFCGLSLFFAYIGNLMHSIKPNYFAGFRIPWALENEDNWRKTHQLASKIWFAGGIALAVVSLIINIKLLIIVFIVSILIMSIIPALYSYNLYKHSQRV